MSEACPVTPLDAVLEKIGGSRAEAEKKLAEILGIDESGIRRLRCSTDKGGTNGNLRDKHKITLMTEGAKYGLSLDWADFLPVTDRQGG